MFTVNRRLRGGGGDDLRRYRYRTACLTGPWRASETEAADDAVRAKQAVDDCADSDGIRWTVPGRIEVRIGDESPTRLKG